MPSGQEKTEHDQAIPCVRRLNLQVNPPLLCPYHNRWGRAAYRFTTAFDHQPLVVPASSTSGPPVIMDADGKFVGITKADVQDPAAVHFAFDGEKRLTIDVPDDATIYIGDTHQPSDHWRHYNATLRELGVNAARQAPVFSSQIEYCTWVEQKREYQISGCSALMSPQLLLNDHFVERYMNAIIDLQLPPGKLTIDHGWQDGDRTYGDWDPDPTKFSNLESTAQRIHDRGFIPGLWIAPLWIHPDSKIAQRYPECIGETIVGPNSDSPLASDPWHYWQPCSAYKLQMNRVFHRFVDMGFLKFKIDMIYARKNLMMTLLHDLFEAVGDIISDIEIEIHHPDPFLCRYAHAVRTNDVLCNSSYDWRTLTREHFQICHRGAFDKVINLDHVGGNDPQVTESDFIEHLEEYMTSVGHPVVSLLPNHVGAAACREMRTYLEYYDSTRICRSDYF